MNKTKEKLKKKLKKRKKPPFVRDNDVVLFMDAFDVLLFPLAHSAADFLSRARAPIVFCGEHGMHQEFTLAFQYNNDNSNEQQQQQQQQ